MVLPNLRINLQSILVPLRPFGIYSYVSYVHGIISFKKHSTVFPPNILHASLNISNLYSHPTSTVHNLRLDPESIVVFY